jgi:plasmid stabilization system protein ParE
MRIVYAPRALRDIDEILAYIQERSPHGARVKNLAKVPDDS